LCDESGSVWNHDFSVFDGLSGLFDYRPDFFDLVVVEARLLGKIDRNVLNSPLFAYFRFVKKTASNVQSSCFKLIKNTFLHMRSDQFGMTGTEHRF
jgi:hypothetical protein